MMMLSGASVLFALLAVLAQGFEHAQVVPNVLEEADISRLHNQVGSVPGQEANLRNGEVTLLPFDVSRILATRGEFVPITEPTNLKVTIIGGSAKPHVNDKIGATDFQIEEEEIIVFLNDNDKAYFKIGQEKIPVTAGTMVSYKGNSIHHSTIVNSGEVRLLGPFSSRNLQDVEMSPCHDSPCLNGGTCIQPHPDPRGYHCICAPGYIGDNCETIACTSSSCKNGGTCVPSYQSHGFTCECMPGFVGIFCDVNVACNSSPCKNGGTCTLSTVPQGFTCTCTPGYMGEECADDRNECEEGTDNCNANAICINTEGSFECACSPGFTGDGINCRKESESKSSDSESESESDSDSD